MKSFAALAAGVLLALAFVGVGSAGHAKSAGLVGEGGTVPFVAKRLGVPMRQAAG